MDEEKKESDYKLAEVPTQYGVAIQTPEGDNINTEMAMVEILNIVKSIQKSVA